MTFAVLDLRSASSLILSASSISLNSAATFISFFILSTAASDVDIFGFSVTGSATGCGIGLCLGRPRVLGGAACGT